MTIKYPNRVREFEVQAQLYFALRNCGFDARGEVTAKADNGRNCRFDIAVFDNTQQCVAIIEVKAHTRDRKPKKTRQLEKYESFGLPVYLCRNLHDIDPIVGKIKTLFMTHSQ